MERIATYRRPKLMSSAAVLALCTFAHVPPALAWGAEGHRVIALIARAYLEPDVRAKVDRMLAADGGNVLTGHDMADEATWADKVRDTGGYDAKEATREWHFVDVEIGAPDEAAACFGHPRIPPGDAAYPGFAHDCIIDKIDEFQKELADPTTVPAERLVALKFLLHLVGDIHQPLHAADDDDRGGNDKRISAGDKASGNLHAFWDTTVVRRLGGRPAQVAGDLLPRVTEEERKRWSAGTPAEWARESFDVAKKDAFGQLPPPDAGGVYELSEAYESMATRDAIEQMEKAGVRLAWLLNRSLGR